MNEQSWEREYMLRIIPEEDQVIHREWIKYYDELPNTNDTRYSATFSSVDLAISQKASADYTAIVSARIFEDESRYYVYITPDIINKRITFPEQMELIEEYVSYNLGGTYDKLFIEAVGYQEALIQQLDRKSIYAEDIVLKGDKRSRLALTTQLIKDGTILFQKKDAKNS